MRLPRARDNQRRLGYKARQFGEVPHGEVGGVVKKNRAGQTVTTCALAMMLTAVAGCSTTQKVTLEQGASCVMIPPEVCQSMTPVEGANRMGLRYMAPGVNWSQYTKVLISPVVFYASSTSTVSASDQQELTNYLYQALVKAIGAKSPLADKPGPGVMRLQVGIKDVEGATPVLRTVSMVVPQARALATLKYVATGTYAFVGGAEAEGLVEDSVTGKVLFAVMDKRVGGGSIETAAQWSQGDAENAMDKWAELAALRLSQLQQGTFTPSGK
jgi:uncharacterized protein DUF3313